MFQCILVSLDGSRASEAVLPIVERMLETCPTQVVLLRVGPTVDLDTAAHEMEPEVEHASELPSEEYDLLNIATEVELRQYLEAIGERLKKTGATPIVEVSFNKPVDEILFFAKHYKADLIAMTVCEKPGIDRWLHRSVAEAVLHRASCPMLLVRAPDESLPRFAPPAAS
jgi:nucleotide-binding universal stress UspA family protein